MKLYFQFKLKPHVCDTFKFKNPNHPFGDSGFRLNGWMKENENGSLVFCGRSEATWIHGSGTCGCIAHLDDIVITGQVNWDVKYIKKQQDDAEINRWWSSFDKPKRY